MRKLFSLLFALICCSMYADELYLVGDGTPIGWEGDGNIRQITKMTETAPGVYEWVGALKHAGEGFKIVNSFGGWDGYHPSSANFAIAEAGTDKYTTTGNDWKWNPANTEAQVYKITLNQNESTLSWEPATLPYMDDEVIYVGTAEELNNLALLIRNNMDSKSYNVKLTADIDYTAYKEGILAAIGPRENVPFVGDFDGQGHTITVDMETKTTRMGLFGTIVGKVHDLKVAGKITVMEKNQVGGICGLLRSDYSAISNCVSTVEIVDGASGDGTIAGIAAVAYNSSTIENCAFYGKINAPGRDGNGGIVSWADSNKSITIKNCLVVADINWKDGADFGRNNPSVVNCYKPAADDPTLANGIFAYEKLNEKVSGGAWGQELGVDALPSPLSTSAKVYANGNFYCDGKTPKDDNFELSNTSASNVDPHAIAENGVCSVCHEGCAEPALVDGIFQIANFGNMMWFANYVNAGHADACAVLTADIAQGEAIYTPAGNVENRYVGTFDGQLHTVTLALNNPALNYQGLFGIATDGATIKNTIVKGSVSGNSYVAGIVGGSNGSAEGKTLNIINCANEATITAAGVNGAGIIGVNMGGAAHFYISNCYNAGNVTSNNESGAITGWTGGDNSTIENTYNIGTVMDGTNVSTNFVRGGGIMVGVTGNIENDEPKLASGDLCVLLNGGVSGGEVWKQTLGEDAYPVLYATSKKVYINNFLNCDGTSKGDYVVTNTEGDNRDEHIFGSLGICDVCHTSSHVETAAGDAECLLPSIKWGGDYNAYTWVACNGERYNDEKYNAIVGTPAADAEGNAWYTPGYEIGEGWSYGHTLPNSWADGDIMGDVYAIRFFTVDGEIPSTVYMPAAHDDAPCEFYINGELVWSETDGWKEDEVVRLTDAQKALIKTDGSVNVFAMHVHQNWGGRYADAGLYTAGNMVNDFNNDVRVLDATIALAKAEGVAADVLDYSVSKSNYRGGIGAGLAKVRQARRIAADGRTETFTGTAPEDNMVAYIYNVGAKMFLAGGNDWGTHASVNHMGAKCVLRANSSGANRFSIATNLPNGRRGANDGLGHNGYVDCPYGDDFVTNEGWAWTFEPLADGTYHIIQSGREGDANKYLGMRDDERLQVDTDVPGDETDFNKWLLVTPEEFENLAAVASEENPVDLGHMIHQATFSQNDFDGDNKDYANGDLNDSKWERNAGSIWNWKGNDANGDYVFEMWNTRDAGRVYLTQEVEGLPEGEYTVSMTGYYRDGNFDSATDGNARQLAYLYAGEESNQVLLPSILEGDGKAPGYGKERNGIVIPDGCRDAAKFFQFGVYTTTINAEVGADGKLEIGVVRDAADVMEKDWVVVDNFRLYYKGAKGTGIDGVESSIKAENNAIYNLAGQRIMKMQKGINIVNGKKILK